LPTPAGRVLSDGDRFGSIPVAVVTATLARRSFASASPIGKLLRIDGADRAGGNKSNPLGTDRYQIIGVVADSQLSALGEPLHAPGVYLSLVQFPRGASYSSNLLVRTSQPPSSLAPALRQLMDRLDPSIQLWALKPLGQLVLEQTDDIREATSLLVVVGGSALLIVLTGIYAVASFAAARRRSELGIRRTLGAQAHQVLHQLIRQQAMPLVIGIAGGSLLGSAFGRLLSSALSQVRPWDGRVAVIVLAGAALTGLTASLIPALRALALDPLEILRKGE
jgi:hypothetical protein